MLTILQNLFFFLEEGKLYTSGSNHEGQLGINEENTRLHKRELTEIPAFIEKKVKHIYCGPFHNLVYTFGNV